MTTPYQEDNVPATVAALADRLLAAYSNEARSSERIDETLERIADAITAAVMGMQWSDALQAARDAHYREQVREDHRAALALIRTNI